MVLVNHEYGASSKFLMVVGKGFMDCFCLTWWEQCWEMVGKMVGNL